MNNVPASQIFIASTTQSMAQSIYDIVTDNTAMCNDSNTTKNIKNIKMHNMYIDIKPESHLHQVFPQSLVDPKPPTDINSIMFNR